MSDLSQQDWISNLNSDTKSIILDVRTDAEVEEGMIPEAKHLDIHQGQDFISAL
jgi:predicted sulfurtransferase